MSQKQHTFRIEATCGPEQVFRALRIVVGHENQKAHEPDFEFDWIGRRVALSANSLEGLEECHAQLMHQLQKLGAPDDALLPGKAEEKDSRWARPYGVLLQDAATYAEMIGRSLVDLGVRGMQMRDKESGVALLHVRLNAFAKRVDYEGFIAEFPFPSYIRVRDEGLTDAPEEAKASVDSIRRAVKRRRKR